MSVALGLGARAGATTDAVLACIAQARAAVGEETVSLNAPSRLAGHTALIEAAQSLGLPLIFRNDAALAAVAAHCVTHSPRVQALYGVGSVAEAAALAGAGEGARLVLPRFAAEGVTCAAARGRA